MAIGKILEILSRLVMAIAQLLNIFQYLNSFTQESIVAPDANVIVAICTVGGSLSESMN